MDSQNDLIINRRRAEAAQKIFPYTSVKTNLRTMQRASVAIYLQNKYWQIANVSVNVLVLYMHSKKIGCPNPDCLWGNTRGLGLCNTVLWNKEYEQNLYSLTKQHQGFASQGKMPSHQVSPWFCIYELSSSPLTQEQQILQHRIATNLRHDPRATYETYHENEKVQYK